MVFKYLLRVFKYLTIAYNNHPVRKHALSLITVHIRPRPHHAVLDPFRGSKKFRGSASASCAARASRNRLTSYNDAKQ